MADVKGDLSGIAAAGTASPKMRERLTLIGAAEPEWAATPVAFWDVLGASGHPVRATVSDMGPLLIGRLLGLNDTQRGVLTLVFKIADDAGLLLLDLKDLRAMLQFVGEHAKKFTTEYGNISAASVGAIQRGLLGLEEQGADRFFGEPMLDIDDLIQTSSDGRGVVNILAAEQLMSSPKLYSTFLLWMLSELFERLPEVGDPAKPKMVFFFDEAHLLFDDAPDALVDKIEQVVRLIRSKGVGVFFVTQNPLDLPDRVLGQLGNRVQHALRAFTPRDQKAVRTAAETLRSNPELDTETVITELRVGEALVSFLERQRRAGRRRARVDPPARIPNRSGRAGRADRDRQELARVRALRRNHRSRVRLRKAQGACERAAARTGGRHARLPPGARRRAAARTHHARNRVALGHPLRIDRPARRPPRRHARVGRPQRRPVGGLRRGARAHARGARDTFWGPAKITEPGFTRGV